VTDSEATTASETTPRATPRVVLVTGGSKGIGRGIAQRLHAAGHRVAATYRSGDVPTGVLGVQCDITDPAQVDAAFKEV
jgi:3-oxoacyl-[acyl-carrier protein] reductase